MDFETVGAADFGRALKGIGLNLLVRDVPGLAAFLTDVFGMSAHRVTADFAIMVYGSGGGDGARAHVFQLHADGTYHANALPALLPEAGPRGGGVELRLYETDPDDAAAKAEAHVHGSTLLHPAENKPHGLRECIICCENGYAWIPSRRLTDEEADSI
jgi:catechol 2,3-dioxygenase-like lactoylglutathione lyase family enzyme